MHREFSHPNLMPLFDSAMVLVPQGEAAFMLFPFMESKSPVWTLGRDCRENERVLLSLALS